MAEDLRTFSKVTIVSAGDSQSAESRELSVKADNVTYRKADGTELPLSEELVALEEAGLSERNIDTDVFKISEDGKLAVTERVVVLPEASEGSSISGNTAILLGAAPKDHSGTDGDGSGKEKYPYGLATADKKDVDGNIIPGKYGHVRISNISNYNDINPSNVNAIADGIVPGFNTLLKMAEYINGALGTYKTQSEYDAIADKETNNITYFVTK